ncbi:MAG TPA: polyphosphate kinase 1, partial [Dyadobacter sp.]|nr:polyphosphate kinase 1 [Dyadobacter sp.]
MIDVTHPYFDINLSWLSNNYRLLLEANDESVPVRERLRFLSLYASQTEEFFRVRITTLMALAEVTSDIRAKLNIFPESLLEHVNETLENQLNEFHEILTGAVLPALHEHGVHLYFNEAIAEEHASFLRTFFLTKLFRYLQPIFLDGRRNSKLVFFENRQLYLVVRLRRTDFFQEDLYATVNVPEEPFGRFLELPDTDGRKHVAFLEDVIRHNLSLLFPGYEVLESYTLRAERDTELVIEDEYQIQISQRILKQLEKRNFVLPSLFFYEAGMPEDMRSALFNKAGIPMNEFHQRGPYLHMQDLSDFPSFGKKLDYPIQRALQNPEFEDYISVFETIQRADQLL